MPTLVKSRLPANPKQLLEVGLRDLLAARENPDIEINMGCWYAVSSSRCVICLAGAALLPLLPRERDWITGSMEVTSPNDWASRGWVTPQEASLLQALDYYRVGNLLDALRRPLTYRMAFYYDDYRHVDRLAFAWNDAASLRDVPKSGHYLATPEWNTPELFIAYIQTLIAAWDDIPKGHRAKYDQLIKKYF